MREKDKAKCGYNIEKRKGMWYTLDIASGRIAEMPRHSWMETDRDI